MMLEELLTPDSCLLNSTSGMIRLSVIIPTWNGIRHLPECLAALRPQLPTAGEVVLVDNGSTDGTAEWARAHYPNVKLVSLPKNLGFAGGVAAGLRAARGELLLLLNDDAFVEPKCISALSEALERRPDIGVVGGVLTFAHKPNLVASAGIRLRRDGVALDLWVGRSVADLPTEPIDILGPSGALALYRRALLEDVGLPAPDFFSYLEDVDLALRAQLRGWQSIVAPQARARHVYSATAGQGSALKQRLLGLNRVRVLVRCLPGPLLLRCLPSILLYDAMACAYAFGTRKPAMIAGRLAGLRELTALLQQRHAIQIRRTAPITRLAQWLEPAPLPWQTLRDQRRLDNILAER
jgi:GT2 family glycosyltransferase